METSPLSLRLAWPAGGQRIRAALGEQESQQTFYFEHTPRGNYDHLAYGLANTPQALFLSARAVKLIIIQPAAHGLARNGPRPQRAIRDRAGETRRYRGFPPSPPVLEGARLPRACHSLAPSHRRSLSFIVCTPRYSGASPRASNCAKS